MSALLAEIIADLRARRIDYAEYLKRIAELARNVQTGRADDTPVALNTPGRRALYNNLKSAAAGATLRESDAGYEALALQIDEAVMAKRPDDWRGNDAKERVIKLALYNLLRDEAAVERIFAVLTQQREY